MTALPTIISYYRSLGYTFAHWPYTLAGKPGKALQAAARPTAPSTVFWKATDTVVADDLERVRLERAGDDLPPNPGRAAR